MKDKQDMSALRYAQGLENNKVAWVIGGTSSSTLYFPNR